jgi:histidyl-tRNA synthetase
MASNVQPPRGMRDFLPEEKARRDAVLATIREAFSAYGYREIETPVAEELGRLESGQGGDNEKLIFRIQRRGLDPATAVLPAEAADLGLRFDLTVPLARFYATHRGELPAVFRAIQIAPVWRAERPQRGRYRQFTQCDIDVLGEPGLIAEVELITATLDALRRLGIADAAVRLNDREVLRCLLDDCGFAAATQPEVLVTVDKLDRVGLSGVAAELAASDADPAACRRLIDLLGRIADAADAVAPAGAGAATGGDAPDPGDPGGAGAFHRVLGALPPVAEDAAARLFDIEAAVLAADGSARLVADPTLVRGMGYYTGPIFEIHHPSFSGSVGGGGRYDGMIGRFAGTDVPGCGFSIGFERVVDLVDASRLRPGRRQLALVHDDDVDAGRLVGWQRALIATGCDVRLVRRTRNLGRLLAGLASEGFDEWVALDATADAPGAAGAGGLERRRLEPAG